MTWTTRIVPELTRRFGVEEVHNVWFTPNDWPGKGPIVGLLIPECEMQYTMLNPADPAGEPLIFVNRPPVNKRIKYWLRYVCEIATAQRTALSIGADTADQAEDAAKLAIRWLPNHRRIALERMYDPANRVANKLS